ncbi:MAG: lysophospholipase L1-like esterase [Candidatus Azotimanducaceae bacterium]|jgi:lysophospholipase L1-like esterase
MNLQTKITLKKETRNPISYNSKIFLFGSCFSENIGSKIEYFKFENTINPFGILFHPIAIEMLITNIVNEKIYTEKDIFFHNERWHCYEAHSELSNPSKEDLLLKLNAAISTANTQLKEVSHVIITLGTSWAYRLIETDTVVANCHKVPQKKFLKELLLIDEITNSLEAIITLIKSVNNNIEIIFTVSPVRHLKDGFVENMRSKSHLLSAIHQVIAPRDHTHYFPSYEIMMDDLRDYRFYNSDMIHPNETAINYIWEAFKTVWIHEESTDLMSEIDTIQKGLSHRPFNKNSKQHLLFLENLQLKISALQENHTITF